MTDKDKDTKGTNKGQAKSHLMVNNQTGESRMITQEDWRTNHAEYLAAGFVRPDGVEDESASE